jgi:S-adenosylmethionine hydrolase
VPGHIQGSIIEIADNGNLITDITAEQLRHAPRDERIVIRCDEHATQCLFDADHQQPEMTFVAVLNPRGQLELMIVGESAKIMLGLRVGDSVSVEWE